VTIKLLYGGLRIILAFDNWPSVLFARLFDRKSGFVAYRKKGFEILIDHRGGDENGTRVCIATDMYRKYLPFLDLPGPARVLDVGANGGGFPLMLRIAGIELSRIVCAEMNPMTFLRLQLNLATNFGPQAVAINAAVCGMTPDTEILLKPNRGSVSNSIYKDRPDSSMDHVAVRTTTLQALYDRYFDDGPVDIVKVDIESAEYDLFASCPDDLLTKFKYLVMELHDPSRTPALVERFAALGFEELGVEDGPRKNVHGDVRAFRGPRARSRTAPERSAIRISADGGLK
jgi:FkbM family methyltransferase